MHILCIHTHIYIYSTASCVPTWSSQIESLFMPIQPFSSPSGGIPAVARKYFPCKGPTSCFVSLARPSLKKASKTPRASQAVMSIVIIFLFSLALYSALDLRGSFWVFAATLYTTNFIGASFSIVSLRPPGSCIFYRSHVQSFKGPS